MAHMTPEVDETRAVVELHSMPAMSLAPDGESSSVGALLSKKGSCRNDVPLPCLAKHSMAEIYSFSLMRRGC